MQYLGWLVGIVLFIFVAPILAFCLIPIPAFFVALIGSIFRRKDR